MQWTRNRGTAMNEPVISVKDLSVAFGGRTGAQVTDRVSFDIFRGEFFALVGESGCGKSVTAMSLLRLLPVPSARIVSGSVIFGGKNLLELPLNEMRKVRGAEISCIFQEPMQALDPVIPVGKQLYEALRGKPAAEVEERTRGLLKLAGFPDPDRILRAYPHELSGGMLQRACIVMALLPSPALIIADEPTTALDVTVQAQVLEVLKKLARDTGTAVLLITHNMGLVAQYAQRVSVMYAGRIVESGPAEAVIAHPMHPYTKALLSAIPDGRSDLHALRSIPGNVPAPADFAAGCRFKDRCPCASEECAAFPPRQGTDRHFAMCFNPAE